MDLYERYTHSFVIRIWVEETTEEAGEVIWRGRIIHVDSHKKSYFQALDDIVLFIRPYLNSMGVRDSRMQRIVRWLKKKRIMRARATDDGKTAEGQL